MSSEFLTSDFLLSSAGGTAIGFGIGYSVKKVIKPLIKFIFVILIIYVGSLLYFRSIGVININKNATDNLISNTQNSVNSFVNSAQICDNQLITNNNEILNQDCVNNIVTGVPIQNIFASLGIGTTVGLGAGFLIGWSRG